MWKCPLCQQTFQSVNQYHYCGDNTPEELLKNKSQVARELFYHLAGKLSGRVEVRYAATKTMIALIGNKRLGYITQFGKEFIELVISLDKPYVDNFCFIRINHMPNAGKYQHVARLYHVDDVNKELLGFLIKAYEISL